MQTVWSRIAQTRGTCGCPQCVQSIQGVSRRATASATRRAKFTTSSTLWYSGIFAAAATFDAGAKIQRREQWDQAIAEVKRESGQPIDSARSRSERPQAEQRHVEDTVQSGLDALVEASVDMFRDVEPHKRKPHWPANTGPPLAVNHLPPNSIYATAHRKGKAGMRRWTPKKMETVMLSMDALQLKIFRALQEGSPQSREEASAAVPVDYRDKIFLSEVELNARIDGKRNDLRRLWSMDPTLEGWSRSESDVPLSSYEQDDEGTFHYTARELGKSLQDLFRQHKDRANSTPALLAKVAYNISLSSAPPTVHTYNALLLGFRKMHPNLVYSVIRSLRETHVTPNEVTNSTVLNHYTSMSDQKQFVRWVELMRGKHGGLALAREDIKITDIGASRLIRFKWREGAPDRVIQMPYPTPNVFGAIIKGVLAFSGFDTALGICEGMGHEGWGICMGGLSPLLMDCANRGDWTSGLAVWRQIQALKGRSATRQGQRMIAVEQIPVNAYAAMLRLCLACDRKETFQVIWRQTIRTHGYLQTSKLTQIIKCQKARASDPFGMLNEDSERHGLGQADEAIAEGDAGGVRSNGNDESAAIGDDSSDQAAHSAGNRANASPAGQVLRELKGLRGDIHRGEDVAAPDHRSAGSAESTINSAEDSAPTAIVLREQSGSHERGMLLREQLDGWLPPSHELEEYEARERPMTMHG
ncbi:hypothetical protein LTR85_005249 [Meristemomyces frigidus]|nr:hypothetical protein LTR85_005249 [Meristemomyces frigidus]